MNIFNSMRSQGLALADAGSPYEPCASAAGNVDGTCIRYARERYAALHAAATSDAGGAASAGAPSSTPTAVDTAGAQGLLNALDALQVGAVFQYDSPGFLLNHRQHRQAVLAALGIAQTCAAEWRTRGAKQAKRHVLNWREGACARCGYPRV